MHQQALHLERQMSRKRLGSNTTSQNHVSTQPLTHAIGQQGVTGKPISTDPSN